MGRIHPEAERVHFATRPQDRKVVRPFLLGFDVTTAYRWGKGGDSVIAFYLKPERTMEELLGLERELLMVYSPFKDFQARSIELHDALRATDRVRLDPLGSVIVSDSPTVRDDVQQYLAGDPERAPIVAVSREDLDKIQDLDDLRAVFVEQYFRRDLFALESPLRRDTLFFGRQDVLGKLLDRFRSGQNSGLFGLRRMGKTSVLYAIGRRVEEERLGAFLYLDCSNPAVYGRRWRDVLQLIIRHFAESLPQARRPTGLRALRMSYSEEQAAYHFENDVNRLRGVVPGGRLLLALDEVENITYGISSADQWSDDFLPFWRTLRSVHQNTKENFCFLIAGVNPTSVEIDHVGRFDNPLFSTVKTYFLPPFDAPTVREMVRRLSRSMGIRCEEAMYPALTAEYGGHPFLIRQACSRLAAQLRDRPATLTAQQFRQEQDALALSMERNVKQVLNVLADWYPAEYEQIRRLAKGDSAGFMTAALNSASLTEHVEGYGLVRNARTIPTITIGLVAQYLAREPDPTSELPKAATIEEKRAESSRRRNDIEVKLRSLAALGLSMRYGERNAANRAMACWSEERRAMLMPLSYRDRWQELMFKELIAVFDKEWDVFQNWFSTDKAEVLKWLSHINQVRIDAHAKDVSDEDWLYLGVCFKRLEECLARLTALLPSAQ